MMGSVSVKELFIFSYIKGLISFILHRKYILIYNFFKRVDLKFCKVLKSTKPQIPISANFKESVPYQLLKNASVYLFSLPPNPVKMLLKYKSTDFELYFKLASEGKRMDI